MSNIIMGKCGALWVTTLAAARALMLQDVADGVTGDISFYYRCFGCRAPSANFVPSKPGDAPVGCTLTPVVVPGAWS